MKSVVIACAAALALPAAAHADNVAGATGRVSTLGLGVEVIKPIGDTFALRAGYNRFDYDTSESASGNDYDAELQLDSKMVGADWRPFAGNFRFTGGMLFNDNSLAVDAEPAAFYNIGDIVVPGDQVGNLTGGISFDDQAPYAGVGWDSSILGLANFAMSFDLGVVYQGSPQVTLSADGPISSDPLFQQELEKEESNVQNEIDDYKYYPVASLGLTFRF